MKISHVSMGRGGGGGGEDQPCEPGEGGGEKISHVSPRGGGISHVSPRRGGGGGGGEK